MLGRCSFTRGSAVFYGLWGQSHFNGLNVFGCPLLFIYEPHLGFIRPHLWLFLQRICFIPLWETICHNCIETFLSIWLNFKYFICFIWLYNNPWASKGKHLHHVIFSQLLQHWRSPAESDTDTEPRVHDLIWWQSSDVKVISYIGQRKWRAEMRSSCEMIRTDPERVQLHF